MTGGGFGQSGHDDHTNRPPGAAEDPERTVHRPAASPEPTVWGGAARPAQSSWGAPWESPAVDYPHTDYPPPSYPAGPPGYQPPGYGGTPYPPPPPAPLPYGAPAAGYQQYPYGGNYYAGLGTNGLAIGSLVSSIFSLFCCQIFGIVSVAVGIVALNQIKQTNQEGHGLAVAGIVIGGVSIAVGVLIGVVIIGGNSR